jgi:hypothetical protein
MGAVESDRHGVCVPWERTTCRPGLLTHGRERMAQPMDGRAQADEGGGRCKDEQPDHPRTQHRGIREARADRHHEQAQCGRRQGHGDKGEPKAEGPEAHRSQQRRCHRHDQQGVAQPHRDGSRPATPPDCGRVLVRSAALLRGPSPHSAEEAHAVRCKHHQQQGHQRDCEQDHLVRPRALGVGWPPERRRSRWQCRRWWR